MMTKIIHRTTAGTFTALLQALAAYADTLPEDTAYDATLVKRIWLEAEPENALVIPLASIRLAVKLVKEGAGE